MKQLKVGEVLVGVRSSSMLEKHGAGYIVRKGEGKTSKKPYCQIWIPREGRPVTLADGSNMWLGDQWEIWCSNAEWLLANWDGVSQLACKRIHSVRELTKVFKTADGGKRYDTGKTLQINAELVPVSVAAAEGWLVING